MTEQDSALEEHTVLSGPLEDETALSGRPKDHTVLSQRMDERTAIPASPSAPPVTTTAGEAVTLFHDADTDQTVAQIYEPRSFVDDPAQYSSAQPMRDGSYASAPALREGDLRRRSVANRARRYQNTTGLLIAGFTALMAALTAGAVIGLVTLATGS